VPERRDEQIKPRSDVPTPQDYRVTDGLAVIGGEAPHREALEPWLSSGPLVVAADSGLDKAHTLGLRPDYVVGDMDSISDPHLLDTVPTDRLYRAEVEKDETDTELALGLLHRHGIRRPLLVGGGGGRLDHLLAILALFDRTEAPAAWLTARDEAVVVNKHIRLRDMENTLVSFFPLGIGRCRMQSAGLKWPLDELEWYRGDHGVSNVVLAGDAEVWVTEGRLLMVRPISPSGHGAESEDIGRRPGMGGRPGMRNRAGMQEREDAKGREEMR
jgi:thiamine pyrophosphokinase